MNFIKKYSVFIIVGLFFLLMFKSCQSCSRANNLDFERAKTTELVDSLNGVLKTQQDSIGLLNNEIMMLKEKNQSLDRINKTIEGSNEQLVKSNNNLINSINNINNSK